MSNTIIKVENLGKKYVIGHQKQEHYSTLRDVLAQNARALSARLRHPLSPNRAKLDVEEFWALKNINFEIKQGDRLGIIGRNGAGKSTLLKILSRITDPTVGRVHIKGRVASLLEVGTGFHPELTGRENVYLNGAVLGMTRVEIRKKFDEIVDFAGIEKFLDTPVKRYSSGMYVRLAFAVAAHLEPEILIVDEVLAVGDAEFQKKCLGKMGAVAKEGRTVLFVSHNMGAIKFLCDTCILLDNGQLNTHESSMEVISRYHQMFLEERDNIAERINYNATLFKIDSILLNKTRDNRQLIYYGDDISLEVAGLLKTDSLIYLECRIFDADNNCLAYYTPRKNNTKLKKYGKGPVVLKAKINLSDITRGIYHLSVYVTLGNPFEKNIIEIDRAFIIEYEGTPLNNGWRVQYNKGNGFVLLNELAEENDRK